MLKKISSFINKPGTIFFSAAVALALISICFVNFRIQVNAYIEEDMRSQIEATQKSSTMLIRNEMNYLKRLTESVASMLSRSKVRTDEDILKALDDYAGTGKITRTLFITLDGHVYTSYAGYLGKNDSSISIDGIPISDISEPVFSQPHYAEDLDEVIFGVIAPAEMGSKKGVLISSYNVKDLSSLLENEYAGGSADIGIVNSDGKVVNGKSAEEFNLNIFDSMHDTEFESSSVETMRNDFASGKSGFCIYCVKGVARYCCYAPVGLNGWYVIVTVREVSLRGRLAKLEHYGFQLAVELVIIMLALLFAIMASRLGEQRKIRLILERAAMTDGLTGIYNRKAAEDLIEQNLRSAGEDMHAALLVIDLDNFKNINDQGGHLFGDTVLRECADRLKDIFGDEGVVGRIGGDEFVVFLYDGRDSERIEEKVNRLIRDFHVASHTGEYHKISVSVGIALTGPDSNSFLTLYQRADDALYRAKQTGKAKLSD